MPTCKIQILWPERRRVSPETVVMWASDSYFNNAPAYRCCGCGGNSTHECGCDPSTDIAPVYPHDVDEPSDLDSAIAWLGDSGEVTFAQRRTTD